LRLVDGRNNGMDPKARVLEEIVEHTKKTIWIAQEPKLG